MNPDVLPANPDERKVRLLEYRPLVRSIANRLRHRLPPHVSMEELEQAGMIGLHEAIMCFEEDRGASFGTYASRRIEGSMLDALRASDELSREARARQREIREAVRVLEHRLGRAPRSKEVADHLGWSLQAFYEAMLEAGAAPKRLEDEALEPPHDEGMLNGHHHDDDDAHSVIDEHADPQRLLARRQRHAALLKAFEALEERERLVMTMIYGEDKTLAEIGRVIGVSESRVSRIHEATVQKLRTKMRSW